MAYAAELVIAHTVVMQVRSSVFKGDAQDLVARLAGQVLSTSVSCLRIWYWSSALVCSAACVCRPRVIRALLCLALLGTAGPGRFRGPIQSETLHGDVENIQVGSCAQWAEGMGQKPADG